MTAAWLWIRPDRRELWTETWDDLKQLAWAYLCLLPIIAVFAWGARVLVGGIDAIRLGLGIAIVGFVALASIAAVCLLGTLVYDVIARRLD